MKQPDWYSRPPEAWPDAARAFYRLCRLIARRQQAQAAAPAPDKARSEPPTPR